MVALRGRASQERIAHCHETCRIAILNDVTFVQDLLFGQRRVAIGVAARRLRFSQCWTNNAKRTGGSRTLGVQSRSSIAPTKQS